MKQYIPSSLSKVMKECGSLPSGDCLTRCIYRKFCVFSDKYDPRLTWNNGIDNFNKLKLKALIELNLEVK